PLAPRLCGSAEAIRRELGRGPFVRRYLAGDGLGDEEGAFVACSFWLVEAYARQGRPHEATELMEELLSHANDVGLFTEEIDAGSGELLGNLPQALSHLALINAARAIGKE